MSTQSEIERIASAKAGIKAALEKKGVDVGEKKLDEYAPLVEQISSGVESFKGRTGAVEPQSGDYTADMVGARPSTWNPTATDVGALPITGGTMTGQLNMGSKLLRGLANPVQPQDAVNLQYAQANFAPKTHNHGVIPISQGGTGVSNMVGTDYTTNRPRGIVLQASEPGSVPNGCLVGVYE